MALTSGPVFVFCLLNYTFICFRIFWSLGSFPIFVTDFRCTIQNPLIIFLYTASVSSNVLNSLAILDAFSYSFSTSQSMTPFWQRLILNWVCFGFERTLFKGKHNKIKLHNQSLKHISLYMQTRAAPHYRTQLQLTKQKLKET